jgi:hypothetical protein
MIATVALANPYTWTGLDPSHYWTSCLNWSLPGADHCYPNGVADDAEIGTGSTVKLVTTQINDLTLHGAISFGAQTGSPVLTVDTLTIYAGTYTDAVITILNAQILAGPQ